MYIYICTYVYIYMYRGIQICVKPYIQSNTKSDKLYSNFFTPGRSSSSIRINDLISVNGKREYYIKRAYDIKGYLRASFSSSSPTKLTQRPTTTTSLLWEGRRMMKKACLIKIPVCHMTTFLLYYVHNIIIVLNRDVFIIIMYLYSVGVSEQCN